MKKEFAVQEKRGSRRKKLIIAVMWLLVSSILLTTVSYAWLVMSVAPEVTGISTNIGSNGSLEMALLNSETYDALDQIRTIVGTTLLQDKKAANVTWGNLVDLNDESYGLNHISLLPTRLNYQSNNGKVALDNLLKIPTYAYDGRIIDLNGKAVTAIYNPGESAFLHSTNRVDYGVRAIGTSSTLSEQGSALAMSKSLISSLTLSAKTQTVAALKNNINDLITLVVEYSTNSNTTYDDDDVRLLQNLIAALQNSTSNIGSALRQGLIAFAAANIEDVDQFKIARDKINNTTKKLSEILADAEELIDLDVPAEFETWVTEYEDIESQLNTAYADCGLLTGDVYTWSDLRTILNKVMNMDAVLFSTDGVSSKPFTEVSPDDILNGKNVEMTLAPGSGVFAKIADFTGDLATTVNYFTDITITTYSEQVPEYLALLKNEVAEWTPADGADENAETKLDATYGYVIDLAFRCNAALSDLLLQTEAAQRVHEDSTAPSTNGGGSYMEFSTTDNNFTASKMVELMDAIRVTFIDKQGNILGVAKLNTSNFQNNDGVIKAPLYLYDYEFIAEDEFGNTIVMGERRKGDNVITALPQNEVVAVSAVVWLDGDIVDNTMVSAEEETSLNGVLNLQFASSADLVPADNADLLYAEPTKTALEAMLNEYKSIIEEGQKTWTTSSWTSFVADYQYAEVIFEKGSANEAEVSRAQKNLILSRQALVDYSVEELSSLIDQVGAMVQDGNLVDKGNGVLVPDYTEDSWTTLLDALANAESALENNANPDLENAYDALDAAFKGLTPAVYYKPYEYEGALYYYALTDDVDTYGKWYYHNRKMVVEDLLILKLNAKKEEVDIATIKFDGFKMIGDTVYVPHDQEGIVPYVELLSDVYSQLSDDDLTAIHWGIPDAFVQLMTATQMQALDYLIDVARTAGIAEDNEELNAAINVRGNAETPVLERATAVAAKAAIDALVAAITENDPQGEIAIDPEMYNPGYTINSEMPILNVATNPTDDVTGTHTISATVYTKQGVVFTLEKTVCIYAPAEGIEASNAEGVINGTLTLEADDQETVTVSLIDCTTHRDGVTSAEGVDFLFDESDLSCTYTWASEDNAIVTVSGNAETCTITAVAPGTTRVMVVVKSACGQEYVLALNVTVNEATQP